MRKLFGKEQWWRSPPALVLSVIAAAALLFFSGKAALNAFAEGEEDRTYVVQYITGIEGYKANAAAYSKSLLDLDAQYKAAVAAAAKKTILFGDRFPFRYLADDYNLKYYAAFVGCSAETEASFETVIFLAKKVDELGLNAVLTIEKSDKKIAKTIVSNTKKKSAEILEMDSLQSITQKDIKAGRSYLSAMKKNHPKGHQGRSLVSFGDEEKLGSS